MLLIEVCLDGHVAAHALLEVHLLGALRKLVLRVAAHLNNLRATGTISEHLTLQHVVKIHFVGTEELGGLDSTKLASAVVLLVLGRQSAIRARDGLRDTTCRGVTSSA